MKWFDPVVKNDISAVLDACHQELNILAGRHVLITGGTGFVGSYLVASLIAYNNNVDARARTHIYIPTRSIASAAAKWPAFFSSECVTWFQWSPEKFDPPCKHCDFVIHAASPVDPAAYLSDPYGTMDQIVSATKQVLNFARRANVEALLYLSSGAVYGPQPETVSAITENYAGAPRLDEARSCYGEAKRFSELLCHVSGVPSTIARLFTFIGPYQDPNGSFAAPDFMRQAIGTRAIRLQSDGSALRTFCYASDLAISLFKLLTWGRRSEAYNVGSSQPVISILEFARLIADVIGGVQVEVPVSTKSAANPSKYLPDTSKIEEIYRPRITIREAIERTYASLAARSGRQTS